MELPWTDQFNVELPQTGEEWDLPDEGRLLEEDAGRGWERLQFQSHPLV